MPVHQRKSLRLQARDTVAVKEELEGDVLPDEPNAPNVLRSHCAVKAETGDGEGKPDVTPCKGNNSCCHLECKMLHTESKKFRRHGGGEYGLGCRYEYIMSIIQQIKSSPTDPVSGVGQRLFHNAFKCSIDAVVASQTQGTEEKTIQVDINSDDSGYLEPLGDREHYLERILTVLHCMTRMRVYDPPPDREVIYYREIKKHIRCTIASHEAKGNIKDTQCADSKDPASYHMTSLSPVVCAVEELIELSSTLTETNPNIWDLNHKNGSAPDVALHVRSNFRSLPEPNWSTEKVNALYYNKLILVLHDLKCSGLAGLPPDSSEKKAFDALLDYLASASSVHVKKADKMAVPDTCKPITISVTPRKRERETYEVMLTAAGGFYEANGLFNRRLLEYVVELRLSCLSFMLKLMKKVGCVVYPERLYSRFGKDAEDIITQWFRNLKPYRGMPPDFVEVVDLSIVVARYASALIKGVSSIVEDAFANLTDMLKRKQNRSEFGPESLRVLSLLDCGAFRKAGDKMEIPLHEDSTCDRATKTKDHRVISLESNTDNLKVLATILQVLKDIGPLDVFVAPSPAEMVLLKQILEHVSFCIDGFLSTKAYHIERELTADPASTLAATMDRVNDNGVSRGFPIGGKFLVESLFEDFERVQEDIDLMIPSLQNQKVLRQNVFKRTRCCSCGRI